MVVAFPKQEASNVKCSVQLASLALNVAVASTGSVLALVDPTPFHSRSMNRGDASM